MASSIADRAMHRSRCVTRPWRLRQRTRAELTDRAEAVAVKACRVKGLAANKHTLCSPGPILYAISYATGLAQEAGVR